LLRPRWPDFTPAKWTRAFDVAGHEAPTPFDLIADQSCGSCSSAIGRAFGNRNVADGISEATVEDLVPREVYVEVLKKLGYEVALNDEEKSAPTNVKAMEMVFQRNNLGKFGMAEKARVAFALLDAWGKDSATIPAATKEKARALFEAINASFDKNLT
jgi:hypothetical protein